MSDEIDLPPRFLWRTTADCDIYFTNVESVIWHSVFVCAEMRQKLQMIDVLELFDDKELSVPYAIIQRDDQQFRIFGSTFAIYFEF